MGKTIRTELEEGEPVWDEKKHLSDRNRDKDFKDSVSSLSNEGDFREEAAWDEKKPLLVQPQKEIPKKLGFLSVFTTILFFYFRNYSSFTGTQPSTRPVPRKPTAIKFNQLRYSAPKVADSFVGRWCEAGSLNCFLSPRSPPCVPRVVSIIGPAGIGKTQLALQYAYDHIESYDVILWINSLTASGAYCSFYAAAQGLSLTPGSAFDQYDKRYVNKVLMWMKKTDARVLIIYDGVLTLDGLTSLVGKPKSGTIILTSRDTDVAKWAASIPDSKVIELGPLSRLESWSLLDKRINDSSLISAQDFNATRSYIKKQEGYSYELETGFLAMRQNGDGANIPATLKILSALKGNPRAISEAAEAIQTSRCLLKDFATDMLNYSRVCLPGEYSVRWSPIFRFRSELGLMWYRDTQKLEKVNPSVKALLIVLCLFHDEDIPLDLLLYPRKYPKSPFSASNSHFKRLGLKNPEPALRLLQRCSVVQTNTENTAISIHPFLRLSIVCYLPHHETQDAVSLALDILLSRFPRLTKYQPPEGLSSYWSDCDKYLSHVQHLAEYCNRWPGIAKSPAFIALQLEFMVATQTKRLFNRGSILPLATAPTTSLTNPSQDLLILSILYSSYTRLAEYIAIPTADVYPYDLHVLYAKYVRTFLPHMAYLISTLLLEPISNLSISLSKTDQISNITIKTPQNTADPTSSIYQHLLHVLHPPSLESSPSSSSLAASFLKDLSAFITENASNTWSQFFLSQCYSTHAAHHIASMVGNEHSNLFTPNFASPTTPKPALLQAVTLYALAYDHLSTPRPDFWSSPGYWGAPEPHDKYHTFSPALFSSADFAIQPQHISILKARHEAAWRNLGDHCPTNSRQGPLCSHLAQDLVEHPPGLDNAERAKATVMMMYLILSDGGRASQKQASKRPGKENVSVWAGFPSRKDADRVAERCLSEMGFRGANVFGVTDLLAERVMYGHEVH